MIIPLPLSLFPLSFISEGVTLWNKDCWVGGHNQMNPYTSLVWNYVSLNIAIRKKINGYK